MKKVKLFLSGILAVMASQIVEAQITINNSHFMQVGNKIYLVRDTLPSITSIGPSGPNQTWSFTNLNVHEVDSIEALNPASTPAGIQFPSSNIALLGSNVQIFGDEIYMYLENSNTELNIVGLYEPSVNLIIPYTNPEKILVYPSTYQTVYSDTAVATTTFSASLIPFPLPFDSIRLKMVKYKNGMVDAYGNLTTNEGTFNTLRFNDTIVEIDSIWGKLGPFWQLLDSSQDTTYETSWLTDDANYGYPLLTIYHDGAGNYLIQWLTLSQPCSDPATPASSISFSSVTSNTANISWVNGDGGARIVVMRAGAPVAATPIDGQTYQANSNFGDPNSALGSGFVVYDGTGTNVTVTGLNPGTTYHVAVFEYNCTPKYYNTDNFPTASFTTIGTGIASYDLGTNELSVYPNPVGMSKILYLNKTVDVTVYNAIGKVVMVKSNTNSIETSELSKGVYFIVTSKGEKVKFIVE
jgi:hypothetical protein